MVNAFDWKWYTILTDNTKSTSYTYLEKDHTFSYKADIVILMHRIGTRVWYILVSCTCIYMAVS